MNIMKKHIDVISKYYYPVAAGIETNVMETYTVLGRSGWDVIIHTSRDILIQKNILAPRETIRGLDVIRYPFKTFGYFPNINWETTDVVALHNFDIFPHFQIMLYALYLKLRGKKKFALFITPHGGFNPEWSVFKPVQRVVKYIYQYTLGVLLINLVADGVRAVSEWEKEEMIKKHLRKNLISVIDNGLEDEAYADLEMQASKEIKERVASLGDYIIQVGRVYPIKNYETAIRAMKDIPQNIKYVIVGPNSDVKYIARLEALIEKLGLKDRVLFLGVIRGADKYYLIKHAQMMVHMALWESFCNVVHEGLSQGLPCIVANNTALPLLIKNEVNGYCVETHDSNGVAVKINYVYTHRNDKEIELMRERNREFGLKNSWREVAGRMDTFYTEKLDNVRLAGKAKPVSV
jgi:glycosyltransferase involved in cell wall biosynthesis